MSDKISNLIVQGALASLIAFSIATWTTVVVKALEGFRARQRDARFRAALEKIKGLPTVELISGHTGPTARVALAGVSAWERSGPNASVETADIPREILELSLRRQIQKERHTTESGLAILASIGTTSPFVGLFGTVWGILHALKSISSAGSASLDVVAGPIGEALIATGVGIAVAVPAVLAFNFFVRRLKVQTAALEDFANSLVSTALEGLVRIQPRSTSGEHSVPKLAEARASNALREARV